MLFEFEKKKLYNFGIKSVIGLFGNYSKFLSYFFIRAKSHLDNVYLFQGPYLKKFRRKC